MNFAILCFVFFFCTSALAQDDDATTDTDNDIQARSCFPDMCELLREFGAMAEKLKAVETRLTESETKLKESEDQILELKSKGRIKVIFSAIVETDGAVGPFNTDTTLIYRRVFTNIGNAYSRSTGIFVAPVAGVYYFSIFYHAGGEHEAKLSLYKNNERMVMTHDHMTKYDTADNGGNAVFLQLQQGDSVYVRLAANTHVWGYNHQTSFSGFLVSKM